MPQVFLVDAFTQSPFAGNPAGVCIFDAHEPAFDADVMQQWANEFHQAETAFLVPFAPNHYQLRWFTPTVEVDLCGHATLASAHQLWALGVADRAEPLVFETKSGTLTATWSPDGMTLDFPNEAPTVVTEPDRLSALQASLSQAFGLPFGPEGLGIIAENRHEVLIEVPSESVLRSLSPNMTLLEQLPYRGVLVTAPSTQFPYDVVSRCFYPAVGVPEDAVTGSAHCCIGPYWIAKGRSNPLHCFQASLRGGALTVTTRDDRVQLTGHAVTTFALQPSFQLAQSALPS